MINDDYWNDMDKFFTDEGFANLEEKFKALIEYIDENMRESEEYQGYFEKRDGKDDSILSVYDLLGVKEFADMKVVRKKYTQLSKKVHPDTNKDISEEVFKDLSSIADTVGFSNTRNKSHLKDYNEWIQGVREIEKRLGIGKGNELKQKAEKVCFCSPTGETITIKKDSEKTTQLKGSFPYMELCKYEAEVQYRNGMTLFTDIILDFPLDFDTIGNSQERRETLEKTNFSMENIMDSILNHRGYIGALITDEYYNSQMEKKNTEGWKESQKLNEWKYARHQRIVSKLETEEDVRIDEFRRLDSASRNTRMRKIGEAAFGENIFDLYKVKHFDRRKYKEDQPMLAIMDFEKEGLRASSNLKFFMDEYFEPENRGKIADRQAAQGIYFVGGLKIDSDADLPLPELTEEQKRILGFNPDEEVREI